MSKVEMQGIAALVVIGLPVYGVMKLGESVGWVPIIAIVAFVIGQLVDSLAPPHPVDQKALKTNKKEVWKYNHQGGNRYGLRITLDNDKVVGCDQKT